MKQFAQLHELILAHDVITIWGHAMPDGDCYGSQIGLRELLRANYPNKRVYAIGSGLKPFFERIAPMDEVSDEEIANSLAILVDVSCLRRVEDTERVLKAKAWIKFDHHRPNPGIEDFPYPSAVDHHVSSAAEIIADFAYERRLKWTLKAAEALYLGMVTDSGRFRYDGVTPHTMELVRRFRVMGLKPASILAIAYYEPEEIKRYRLWLRRRAIVKDHLAYVVVHQQDYLKRGLSYEVASSMVNAITGVGHAGIHAMFTEGPDGIYRGELRSNKHYPVQPIAAMFKGGGHLFAAGLTVDNDGEAIDHVVEALLKARPLEIETMYEKETEAMIRAAKHAEKHILSVYETPFDVEIKEDDSPVTAADKGADEMIREELSKEFPEYGFLTEESTDTEERFSKKAIWIIDPVDGTKEFVSKNGQFTTNIALCVDGEIVAGVINAPTLGITYYAFKNQGAFRIEKDGTRTKIHVSERTKNLRVLRSISFFKPVEEAFLEAHKDKIQGEPTPVGAALKFCAIAEGRAELFYRGSGGTKEWDVAAGDIVLKEAGGLMVQPNGEPFVYNRKDVYNRDGYIMANRAENLFLD